MSTLTTLINARTLITHDENWLRYNRKVYLYDINAYGYCALGAIEAAMNTTIAVIAGQTTWHHREYLAACEILVQVVNQKFKDECIDVWGNNLPTNEAIVAHYNNSHSHEEVLAWFDRAIARQRTIEGLFTIEPTRELEHA